MNKLYSIFLLMVFVLLSSFIGCERNPDTETLDFKAEFFTVLKGFEENDACEAPLNFLNTQEGSGTATLLGGFTTQLTFCVNPSTFEYANVQGSFVGENGDEIFITGGGQVLPSDEPGYDLEFMDPFEIIGGTGKFKNAKGRGYTKSFVNNNTGQTDHVWTGKITVFK